VGPVWIPGRQRGLLLGGRAGDLLGRRRLLAAGTTLFAACSLAGGLAANAGMLIGARIGQGAGAALMAPAGPSILTTTSSQGTDRSLALGVWGTISAIFLVAAAVIALRATDTRGEPPAHPGHSPASHDGIRVPGLTETRIRVTAPGAWPDTRPQTTPAKPPHPGLTRA
jgi:MFS family permease